VVTNGPRRPAELTIVVPTRNERGNIAILYERLEAVLQGIDWEVVFVDDNSTDGTQDAVITLARQDARIRLIERVRRSGLSSAIIEGMMSSTAPVVAVMDCDLQHDEKLLPTMFAELKADATLDLVVGSRHVEGGSIVNWSKWRHLVSRVGEKIANPVLPAGMLDPMSGFFMLRREFLWRHVGHLTGRGFKTLVDLLSASRTQCKFKEIPYQFGARVSGESKLGARAVTDLLVQIVDHVVGRFIPVEFLLFLAVGIVGVCVHVAVMSILYVPVGVGFSIAYVVAALVTMAFNFFLNNVITFANHAWKSKGIVRGLLIFYVLCSAGLLVSFAVASLLFDYTHAWLFSAIAGAFFGGVWNYSTNNSLNWRAISS
jgi:dolichol-phosphate mannosyltransferase